MPAYASIVQLVRERARSAADRTAICDSEGRCRYRDLERRSDEIASYLLQAGAKPNELIGVLFDRSAEAAAAVLGVLKSGAAYVPFNPAWPRERLDAALHDSGASILLTDQPDADAGPREWSGKVTIVRADTVPTRTGSPVNIYDERVRAENLAYAIYTSGSTGKPKAALVTHSNLLHSIWARILYYSTSPERLLFLSPLSFDSSVAGLFWTLGAGGTLCIPRKGTERDPSEICRSIRNHQITHLIALPSIYDLVLQASKACDLDSLRLVIVAGETCSANLVRRHHSIVRQAELFNEYGPTECTVWATVCRCRDAVHESTIPIGRAIPNTEIYVLDEAFNPVRNGLPGEVYIGGPGVCRGYLNRPELTAERFLRHRFAADPRARLYRTGDRARWRPDGQLEFLGRTDQQVKVCGQRIELNEVEAAVKSHPLVHDAAVVARSSTAGQCRILAYYVAAGGGAIAPDELRAYLREKLPGCMVPAQFIALERLPLTEHGKVDRPWLAALDEPPINSVAPDGSPHDKFERELTAIWQRILDLPQVGVRDDFFDLGGNSIAAAQVFEQIRRVTGLQLPLNVLLEAPTIQALSRALRRHGFESQWKCLVPLKSTGRKPPLFLIHSVGGNLLNCRDLIERVDPEQPVYGFQSCGLDRSRPPLTRVDEMARLYISEMKELQPEGPYFLAGASFGGVIAFEMARQLEARNDPIGLLCLIDSYHLCYEKTGNSGGRSKLYLDRFRFHLRQLRAQSVRRRYIQDRIAVVLRRTRRIAQNKLWALAHRSAQWFGHAIPRAMYRIRDANYYAAETYVPGPFQGRVTLFHATELSVAHAHDCVAAWRGFAAGGLDIHPTPGDHVTMLQPPHVSALAAKIQALLDQSQAPGGSLTIITGSEEASGKTISNSTLPR